MNDYFMELVRQIEDMAKYDYELSDSLEWVREEADKHCITFEALIFAILKRYCPKYDLVPKLVN